MKITLPHHKTILEKVFWATVVFFGIIILIGLPLEQVKKMTGKQAVAPAAAAPAPKAIEDLPKNIKLPADSVQQQIVVIEQDHDADSKSWIDYGNAIVGWIVALAGAYKLVRRPAAKSEDNQPS